jgi:hypothetical protein
MKHFENLVLDLAQHKPLLCLHYVDDTSVAWPHGPEWLKNFLSHLSSLRPSIRFSMEIESDSVVPSLDDLVTGKGQHWPPKFTYRKPTHTG